jgi:hypothetical protein
VVLSGTNVKGDRDLMVSAAARLSPAMRRILVQSTMIGPDWLTGGAFGVEASVVALLVCAAVGVTLIISAVRKGNVVAPVWHR